MNYRHIYHAGNFADIFKHIILCRVIEYFKRKEQAFRVIDTHAGIGLYNLYSEQAQKTCEWHEGVMGFLNQKFSEEQQNLIAPWLQALKYFNKDEKKLKYYPGSPMLARFLLRKQDRLSAIELHQQDYKLLKAHFINDYQSKIIHLDGWLALKSQLPCKEKRTIVLVDPPFEEENEFQKLTYSLLEAYKRSARATYLLWYPIKYHNILKQFYNSLINSNIKNILKCELYTQSFNKYITPQNKIKTPIAGCGVILVNPPFIFANELNSLRSNFLITLGKSPQSKLIIEQLTAEK